MGDRIRWVEHYRGPTRTASSKIRLSSGVGWEIHLGGHPKAASDGHLKSGQL
jgi:hypothetical protein